MRFRLLNASNARVYNLGFAGDRALDLIATDGGLLGAPVPLIRVQLSPGERVEIIARFEPGERAVLRSFAPDLGMNAFQARFAGGDDRFDVLQVRAGGSLRPVPPPPGRLTDLEGLREVDAVRTRTFDLDDSNRINGRRMDSGRADHTVVVGTTEVWDVRNNSGTIHNFTSTTCSSASSPTPEVRHHRGFRDGRTRCSFLRAARRAW